MQSLCYTEHKIALYVRPEVPHKVEPIKTDKTFLLFDSKTNSNLEIDRYLG
ncbi:MAG: hypothetical protein M3Q78_01025 [Acidobacteriota bacterium]|nr:hypothetical protein [Acidobacteriota bacterium]